MQSLKYNGQRLHRNMRRMVYFLRRGRGLPCAPARGFFLPEMRAASPPPASAQSGGTRLTPSDAVTAVRSRSAATTPEEFNAAAGAALLFTATNAPANDDRKTQTYAQSAAVSDALPLFRAAAAHTAVVAGIRSSDAASPVRVDLRADVFSMRVTTFVLYTAILFEDALLYDPKMRIASAFVMLSVMPKSMHWEYIFSISPCTVKACSII